MELGMEGWRDLLTGPAIPAEAVNWERVVAYPEEAAASEDTGRLDAEDTIGDPPFEEKDDEE
ncbi:hypothetical protein GCM10010912_30410 [Paenibacillus albidus]|uniref:Uncharacterized protein n=2 Tax=Paenibacillus albidus TaxID=2041023 RepID=A0A917CEV7_9BACL|nr:hypothetical protein GCM10010912_30410 [Paenibacillus albidus]